MVQSVRGMRDVLPAEGRRWRLVEDAVRHTLSQFAYEEVQLPLLEFTELFARGVGEATDIVEKEMYTLADRDGDSLSLRPEGTASCVRALNDNGLLYNQTQRVFYTGAMFRYEKPQKGRYRQFYQIGAEAFGMAGPDVDAELIAMCAQFWQRLGIAEQVTLEINTLGAAQARREYKAALVDYLTPLKERLDVDSQRRLATNPLRILDSKEPATRRLLADAPALPAYVDQDSLEHFERLLAILDARGIAYVHNPNLVRGLDYYTHTVFEWVTDKLGAQGTICAGGRYDGLVEQLGGRPTPAVGFALGLDRVVLLHEAIHQNELSAAVDVYVCYSSDAIYPHALDVSQTLRQACQDQRIRLHMGGGNFKKQLKRADASGAQWAVLLGDDEIRDDVVTVKRLRDGVQFTETIGEVAARLASA